MTRKKGEPPKVKVPPGYEFYKNNKIVTAERVAEIDKELSEILNQLGDDDQITPGRPPKDWPSRTKR